MIDETPTVARVLSFEFAISSLLDMSIRSIPGDHELRLQQVSLLLLVSFQFIQENNNH